MSISEKNCSVCNHQDRREIEACIFDGGDKNTLRDISKKFNVKPGHILRHKEKHMVDCAQELVEMVTKEYNKQLKETGVSKALSSLEVLDLVISKAPNLLDNVTMNDVLKAIKLKGELLGEVTQNQVVHLDWIKEIPDVEEKKENTK